MVLKHLFLSIIAGLPMVGSDSTIEKEVSYTYVYVCQINSYWKIKEDSPRICTNDPTHFCSYTVNKDLGLTTSEEQLKKAGGMPSTHRGCSQLL